MQKLLKKLLILLADRTNIGNHANNAKATDISGPGLDTLL